MTSKDLIYRQQAIDELRTCQTYLFDTRDKDMKISLEDAEYCIERLPSAQPEVLACGEGELSAQPERKRGKWITNNPNNPYESDYCKCSVCGYTNCTVEVLAFDGYNFCPNCGADMRGEQE